MSRSIIKGLAAVTVAALIGSAASAAPVNLSTWTGAEGSGLWTIAGDNNSVFQSRNTVNPTVFHNGVDSQGTSLSGTIKVETTSDNDFIGFVLGFQSGDITRAATDYILIDWKQANQPAYSACDNSIDGIAGLAISRVTGRLDGGQGQQDGWCHTGNVTELARANTLGSTGWVDNTLYDFDLEFTATNIKVFVNSVLEINLNGTFANGAFGFYNYSQASVRYAGLEEDVLPPTPGVPLPASVPLLLAGLGALGFMGRRKA